jgi:hypothetical protein
VTVEKVRHAGLVSFTWLKAFALDQRHEYKDVHDIAYCLENAEGGIEAAAEKCQEAQSGRHANVVDAALAFLHKHFCDDDLTQGYVKDGAVAVDEIDGEMRSDAGAEALQPLMEDTNTFNKRNLEFLSAR